MPRSAKTKIPRARPILDLLFAFKKHAGLPLLFLLLIFLPLADRVFKISKPVSIKENRKLAAMPQFAYRQPWAYLKNYEAYFNDHFGFRTQLVLAYNRIAYRLFRTSPTEKVLIGRQGWLFLGRLADFTNEIDYYRAIRPFSLRELVEFKNVLEARRDWLADRGIQYLFMLAPNKSTIYPEFMPAAVNRVHPRTRMDQLADYLTRYSDLKILDLRPALLGEKRSMRIYNKTDSHWNELGGYFAYREMMRRLGEYFPGVQPMPLSAFVVGQASAAGGDLAALLSLQRDLLRVISITVEPKVPFRARPAAPTQGFAPSNIWIRMDATECAGAPIPAAVMVRDSFAHQLIPFLSETFARIVYIWDWDLHFYPDVIEKEKPRIVIDEMAERSLLNPLPVNPPLPPGP
jgi:alginate O-acetyltransferase complex protein AlgJ